jgi:hypothetical protein
MKGATSEDHNSLASNNYSVAIAKFITVDGEHPKGAMTDPPHTTAGFLR